MNVLTAMAQNPNKQTDAQTPKSPKFIQLLNFSLRNEHNLEYIFILQVVLVAVLGWSKPVLCIMYVFCGRLCKQIFFLNHQSHLEIFRLQASF